MRNCESSLPLYLLAGLMGVRLVKRSSLVRFEFYTRPKGPWSESEAPLGFIEFGVKEAADFERLAPGKVSLRTHSWGTELASPVNVRKKLSGGSSKITSGNEVTFSVTAVTATKSLSGVPSYWESPDEKEARKKSELSLANYIISHPIPEGWKLQRTTDDKVYFFNLKDSKPTATLWYDPLHGIAPDSKLEPLPPDWKRCSENGEIRYTSTQHANHPTTHTFPESQGPMTFEHVLKPVQHHFPHVFYVDSDER